MFKFSSSVKQKRRSRIFKALSQDLSLSEESLNLLSSTAAGASNSNQVIKLDSVHSSDSKPCQSVEPMKDRLSKSSVVQQPQECKIFFGGGKT